MKSIVLAEDSVRDAELILSVLLEKLPASGITHVRDGVELLDFLHRRGAHSARATVNPDLILLDLKMPKVDGKAALLQIKADACLRTIPLVVLTSSREPVDVRDCYAAGGNAYVVKPLRFSDLEQAVRDLVAFWIGVNQPAI